MEKFKGTPGPWAIEDKDGKWNRIVDSNENLIVTCYAMQNEDDANANLIAAAPDLLEALYKLTDYVKLTEWEPIYGVDSYHPVNLAEAAIKKALGE